jgi:hypothetical protein
LLSNVSSPVGKHIRLELRGVESSRDAVGTEVTIVAGEQQWTRQLTAGDGYQASNERQLIFGIGERDSVDRILIDWPSGRRQEFGELTARRAYLIVEGKSPQTVFDPALAP